jgi:hypothetical protein
VARFTKCLFRGELDMYRRWRGITAITLVLLYEEHFGWETETVKKELASHEAVRLYETLDAYEKEAVRCIYPPDARLDLAQSFAAALHLFVELSKQKAGYFHLALDHDFIRYIQEFMNEEIDRYHWEGSV